MGLLALSTAGLAQDDPGAAAASREYNLTVQRYCVRCHRGDEPSGGLSLERFDIARAAESPEIAEKMIRKLQTGMMPARPSPRPQRAVLDGLWRELAQRVDAAAATRTVSSGRTFQRLNRAEYERSISDLLLLHIDAGVFLPEDTVSAGFDNVADAQGLSATVMEGYLSAASEISRLAVGDPEATRAEVKVTVPRYASQWDQIEGAPFGSRGGASFEHIFPADGEYQFTIAFYDAPIAFLFGYTTYQDEQIEISIGGERVALLDIDALMDADNQNLVTAPIFVRAGPQRVSAAFLRRAEGPVPDILSPHDWSLADRTIGAGYGVTTLPHLRDLTIGGPLRTTGVSATRSRQKIFRCRPTSAAEEPECARQIVSSLAAEGYRRPVTAVDLEPLMSFYRDGAATSGFEAGVRSALEAILASPHFVFRFERLAPGGGDRIGGTALAARLSFFLWARPPDQPLIALAEAGRLADPAALEAELARMLADPRSEALASRFAAQWLRLQDLDKVHPNSLLFPDYYEQLAHSMRRETELFFSNLIREDRSVLELFDADYTFVDQRLAHHYGIAGVQGDAFRRVSLEGPERRGLLGNASVLTLTSHADRTSPVLRGKWLMSVLLGSPPPPPPPNVPELEATSEVLDGKLLTVRERMEAHRANPACASCHRVIDPLGLALENFDVTGRLRTKDNGTPVDTTGTLYDGRELSGPADLRRALLDYPEALVTSFTENLLAYALGRRIETADMPAVRAIVARAAPGGYRVPELIRAVAVSDLFTRNDRGLSARSTSGGETRR